MDSISIAERAIQAVSRGKLSYCKFLSANDTGDTGAHQAGIYIAKMRYPYCLIHQASVVKIKTGM